MALINSVLAAEEANDERHELCESFDVVLEVGYYSDGIIDVIVGLSAVVRFDLNGKGFGRRKRDVWR